MISLTTTQLKAFAETLDAAASERREVIRLTAETPTLSLTDAYAIQDHVVDARLQRGQKIIGYKMGLTSRAKMRQMNVHSPIFGALTSDMLITPSERPTFIVSEWIHPKIEPEVGFILGQNLSGDVTPEQAYAAVESVFPAMEIIDSRYKDFKFELPDVIADNCSSAALVIARDKTPRSNVSFEALGNLGMIFTVRGAPAFASSSALFGHPAASLAELSRLLSLTGRGLKAGMVILAGAATEAVRIEAGDEMTCEVQDLGKVSLWANEQRS